MILYESSIISKLTQNQLKMLVNAYNNVVDGTQKDSKDVTSLSILKKLGFVDDKNNITKKGLLVLGDENIIDFVGNLTEKGKQLLT